MDRETRIRRLRFRAWHRGTREADYLIGGYFDIAHAALDEAGMDWLEALLEEEDVEIMAWAIGTLPVPERYAGALMQRMQMLNYIEVAR